MGLDSGDETPDDYDPQEPGLSSSEDEDDAEDSTWFGFRCFNLFDAMINHNSQFYILNTQYR